MTLPGQSDTPSSAAAAVFYCVIEYEREGFLWSMSYACFATDVRAAAEKAAGVQLALDARPRRIRVYSGQPVDFEWKRVENYLMGLGEKLG